MTMETEFICYWLALETMANAHARAKGKTTVMNTERFRQARETFESTIRRQFPADTDVRKLVELFGSLNFVPIRDRLASLLSYHNLPPYVEDVRRFSKSRNDLLHGRLPTDRGMFSKNYRRIMRLVEKLVLKLSSVYGEPYLHQSLGDKDLLSR